MSLSLSYTWQFMYRCTTHYIIILIQPFSFKCQPHLHVGRIIRLLRNKIKKLLNFVNQLNSELLREAFDKYYCAKCTCTFSHDNIWPYLILSSSSSTCCINMEGALFNKILTPSVEKPALLKTDVLSSIICSGLINEGTRFIWNDIHVHK